MKKDKIHFVGFLAHFDSKSSNFKLEHGFEIRCDSLSRAAQLVGILDNTTMDIAQSKLIKTGVNSYFLTPDGDRYVHYIYNSFVDESEHEKSKKHQYLMHVINIMKLFKEGDVNIPLEYQFYYKNRVPKLQRMAEIQTYSSRNRYSLPDEEIKELQEFIRSIKFPFKKKFLKLAFENYQLSYYVNIPKLQFLTLMNCMEVLFHPSDRGELRYRISRNLAVFIGKNKEDSEKIFKKIRDFYDKRSDIVHKGEAEISKEDVLELRSYARESIKKFYRINKDKDEILKLLNFSGFGESPK